MSAKDFRRASGDARAEVKDWAKRVLADFLRRMPKGVKFAAVMHLDEGHVHLHILGVNLDDPKLSANRLHVGKQAAEAWRMAHGPAQTLTSLPRPEPIPRPKKPKKPKPSKNRATQKKRDAEHAAALAKWEEACETVEAANAKASRASHVWPVTHRVERPFQPIEGGAANDRSLSALSQRMLNELERLSNLRASHSLQKLFLSALERKRARCSAPQRWTDGSWIFQAVSR